MSRRMFIVFVCDFGSESPDRLSLFHMDVPDRIDFIAFRSSENILFGNTYN
jgi:hypothetical protein